MATTPRVVSLAVVGMFIAAAAGMTQAGTINYRLAIDDIVAGNHVITPGSTIKVTIEANVPDMSLTPSGYGGLVQYAFSLLDSTSTGSGSGLLPQASGSGFWVFTSVAPCSKIAGGKVDSSGYDVEDLVGGLPFGEEEDYKSSVGAGPGVWTSVGYGYFTYTGGTAVLTLEPRPLAAQYVWGDSGMEFPTLANGYSTTITPEPATLGLLAFGLGAVALRKRRR